ncbi:uncharacterized protein N7459_002351 [Penicillium hispanicum]|uniref:uncharacterized protein n=1 Tax=Penicillium hispanicum TaxID=1080232 RepID=UPI00254155EB|nr:uncharacterized protein N7459_002351 [Penicillium hispanicum]KAJ5591982.1 hypothetical protein N7459_002351 [Penicillium hispanicum]
MVSKRHKPQPDLQVPVPTFPLSSPISEEISSPSCSSAEDRELERNRPFDFLVKATRQKVDKSEHRDRHAGSGSRLSFHGITKKKKNTPKPVGLNLVTDFSLAAPPKNQNTEDTTSTSAPFVDLNDLKVLSKAREKERSAQKTKTTSSKKRASVSRGFQRLTDERDPEEKGTSHNASSFLDPKPEDPFSDRFDHGLSPSDRNVMIGLAVPSHESLDRTKEFDSAGDQHAPLTPSIIVTPAREDAPWSTSSPEGLRPRATSSVYSQPTPRLWQNEPDVPPVPAIPEQHALAKKQAADSEFLSAHFNAMTRKRRSLSAGTIFEVDSPKRESTRSILDDNDQTPLNRLSVNTEASRPQSQGWWTYLLSPLLGKKSPLSPNFPRDDSLVVTPADTKTKQWWEKETSSFSPDTPETAVTNPFEDGTNSLEQSRSLGGNEEPTPITQRQTTHSFMFPGRPIQGEAAEYYQACAHELFSKTPYFECHNHVCSITPPGALPIPIPDADAGETRDRGLILAEAGIPGATNKEANETVPGKTELASRGLLIDVDSPTGEGAKQIDHTKAAASAASVSSSDSWASTVVSDHEKGLPEPPHPSNKAAVIEQPAQKPVHEPPPAPIPIPEPLPPPAEIPVSQQPAPPQIINTISPPASNVHYPPPAEQMPPQAPVIVERAVPHYVPVFPPTNPFHNAAQEQPPLPVSEWPPAPSEAREIPLEPEAPRAPVPGQVPPSGPESLQEPAPPHPSEPISPGFQREAGGPGSIQLATVNAPAPIYSQYPREYPNEAALPPRYDIYPPPNAPVMNPNGVPGAGESRRRRLEREDKAGRKVCGLWRGRGCFSRKGRSKRSGREGRVRRRWYLAICIFFLIIVILAIVLATTLTRKGDTTPVQSQWLNLTGYPPMPTGIATIVGSETQEKKSTCISPSSLWSCDLPKGDQQSENQPYSADHPSFRVEIRFRNGTYPNSTDTAHKVHRRSDSGIWTPSPSSPSLTEQAFLGNTTDGNSVPYAGEETPFFMSVLSPVHLSSAKLLRRSDSNSFPNLSSIFPAPAENSDGTAAAATLYPLPSSQPVRLYNRGRSDEHYGFYTYFDKSIFLASKAPLNDSGTDFDPHDTNGGSSEADAHARCTWSQTRFLVQIWTQSSKMGYVRLPKGRTTNTSSTSSSTAASPTATASTATSYSSATDYTRPGSFPYPITITLDRHGGDEKKKLVYCYAVEENGHYNITDRKLQVEDRGVGGTLVNPASGIFDNVGEGNSSSNSTSYGGVDGGTGGCGCQWVNWISTS